MKLTERYILLCRQLSEAGYVWNPRPGDWILDLTDESIGMLTTHIENPALLRRYTLHIPHSGQICEMLTASGCEWSDGPESREWRDGSGAVVHVCGLEGAVDREDEEHLAALVALLERGAGSGTESAPFETIRGREAPPNPSGTRTGDLPLRKGLLVLLAVLLLSGCATGAGRLTPAEAEAARGVPVAIEAARNLSGRPVTALDERWYLADSLTLQDLLSGGPTVDLLALLGSEAERLLVSDGWKQGEGSDNSRLHLALTRWDGSRVGEDGTLEVGVAAVLSDRAGVEMARAEVVRAWRLLEPVVVPGGREGIIFADGRTIEGRYRQIVASMAREVLHAAGLVRG